jgi:DNA-binding IclR family transcriptional regulator
VVGGSGSPFQKRVLEQLDLPKSTARAALTSLVASATVEQRGEEYVVVDPLFAEWIERINRGLEAEEGQA